MEKQAASPFTVRLEPDLRKALEDCARNNGNSLQVEVVKRLRESLGMIADDDERIRQIALDVVREELSKVGITYPPEREDGFAIPMQRKAG